MATLRELLASLEERTFTGRQRELEDFDTWLEDPSAPPILNVTGRGGVGKTALVRRFEVVARDRGREVVTVDGHVVPPHREDFLAALGGDLDAVVDDLNRRRPLLVVDTFDEIAAITRFLLEQFLPRLDSRLRLVVASRHALFGPQFASLPWNQLVRPMPLTAFSLREARAYLAQRGIEGDRVASLMRATRRHPLALSLAADLAVQLGDANVGAHGDWHLTLRTVAERLLRDAADPQLRRLLEAASVVRQFDADVLGALTDPVAVATAFDRLCELSVVRPSEHGLRLHDDVRRILADDLRWRHPDRHDALRHAALVYWRDRMAEATGPDRERFLHERLFLWEHALIQATMYEDDSPGDIWLERFRDDDPEAWIGFWEEHARHALPPEEGSPAADIGSAELGRLLGHPDAQVMMARHRDGHPLAMGPLVAVTTRSLPVLPDHVRAMVEGLVACGELELGPEAGDVTWLGPIAAADPPTGLAGSARLAQWCAARFIRGGTFLVSTRVGSFAGVMEAFGFQEPPCGGGAAVGARWLTLRLAAADAEAWLERITATAPGATAPTEDATEPAPPGVPEPPTADPVTTGTVLLKVLGTFALVRDGHQDLAPQGLPAQLLKLLAVAGGKMHAEEAAETLWPDAAQGRGRTRLRNVLSRLRDTVGPLVVRDGETIALDTGVTVDAIEFEGLARRALAHLGSPESAALARQAVALYQGDLLPTDPYEGWVVTHREVLRRLLIRCLDVLAEAARAGGDLDEAVALLDRSLEIEPYDEERYVRAAALLRERGQHGAARAMLRRCRRRLHELDLPVSSAFRTLAETLQLSTE